MKAQFCAVTLLHFYSCAVTLLHFSVLSLSCTFLFYAGHLNAILVEDVEGNWSSLSRVAELQQLMTQLDVKVGGWTAGTCSCTQTPLLCHGFISLTP